MHHLLGEYLWRYRWRYVAGLTFTLASNAFALTSPWLVRQAIDSFSPVGTTAGVPLWWFAAGIVGASLLEAVCRFFSRQTSNGGSRLVEFDLRNRFFAHLETLEPAFFQRNRTGDLVARATNDLSAVRMIFGPGLFHMANTVVLFVVALVLMFQISATLGLWAFLVAPTATVVYGFTRARVDRRFTRVQEQFGVLADHAQETFAGQRVVKAYAQEAAEIERFRRASQEYVWRQLSQLRLTGLMHPAMTGVLGLLTVVLLFEGGRELVNGQITLGQFVQFYAYLGMLAFPMSVIGWISSQWQQGLASLRRIHDVFETRPSIVSPPRPVRLSHPRGEISFRDVSLRIGDRPILDRVNLMIPAGATFALVGPLGSGKSSLASLVPRLVDPTEGQVLVDGVDVRELALDDLRRQVGYVPQETLLFSGPLRENIAYGILAEEATEERMRDALHLSRLENDLDQWPAGLQTRLGERGVTLSGGQRQRTAIARAVVKDPPILILDDALSSVDARTEQAILEGLRSFMANRTSLVIAHRVSTVRDADCIVVLEQGRIVETGTHADLVERGGVYARIYRRQLIAAELGVDEDDVAEKGDAGNEPFSQVRHAPPRLGDG